jgi:tyrosyl-tRNA synthetase
MALKNDAKMMEKEIDELLSRGAGEFIDPDGKFKEKLLLKSQGKYDKPIIIKFGIDPTRPDIHIGHAVIFRKLRKFQDLGCTVVFLVGDFTAQIGDPTGKSKVRPEIDQKEVEQNMTTYLEQVGRILNTDKSVFSWIRNSDWFINITDLIVQDTVKVALEVNGVSQEFDPNSFVGKAFVFEKTRMQINDLGMRNNVVVITLRSFLSTLKKITHAQLVKRDLFQDRLKKNEDLYMHEMMYPILQGIDSVVIRYVYKECDLEIGGTDQTFNMLMGRTVMKDNDPSREPQAVLSLKLLEGTDGKEKMSKSLDNYIGITDEPSDMYGKVMSVPDASIANYFELCTYTSLDDIEDIKKDLEKGKVNPKDIKMRLAREIVAIYHGDKGAMKAEEDFINTFSKGGIPDDIKTVEVKMSTPLVDILLEEKIVASKTEYRRLMDDGAITFADTGNKITSPEAKIDQDVTLKIGKRRFIKIIVT